MKLTTSYLGLSLAHPFIAGASPLSGTLDGVRRLEDGGAAAIVLPSLFEEQITLAESSTIHHRDPHDETFAASVAMYPKADDFTLTPDAYLEHLRRSRAASGVPIIASLNGMTTESWVAFAARLQQAGAAALELNIYQVTTELAQSGMELETNIRDVVVELKRTLQIPIAVKLGPFFTAFANLAHRLDVAGADGLVLFNRFYQPDIDIGTQTLEPHLQLSTSAELLLRLRWLAILRGRVRCSLAASGGVLTPVDGVKALLAGADAVQLVSAIVRNGTRHFTAMKESLMTWMEGVSAPNVEAIRGRSSLAAAPDTNLFERAGYIRTLQSWRPDGAGNES